MSNVSQPHIDWIAVGNTLASGEAYHSGTTEDNSALQLDLFEASNLAGPLHMMYLA